MDAIQRIHEFYDAFARRDAETMGCCYHADATFEDPAFGLLTRAQTVAMWKMLCARSKDLEIALVRSEAEGQRGFADWEAKYPFSKTGRRVHNKVHSEFSFRDGLIVKQKDTFDFWEWSSMALGASGRLLGWTPLLKGAVRRQAKRALGAYMVDPR